jgi:hypothetical protein
MIYNYAPSFQTCTQSHFACMFKTNHVYVLNHDLKSLEQEKDDDEEYYKRTNNADDLFTTY